MDSREASARRGRGDEACSVRRRLRRSCPRATCGRRSAVRRGSQRGGSDGLAPVGGEDPPDPHRGGVRLPRLAHPAPDLARTRRRQADGLHLPVEEVSCFDQGEDPDTDPSEGTSHARRPPASAEPGDQGLVRLLPARGIQAHLLLRRPLRLLADRRLAEEAPPQAEHAHRDPSTPARMADQGGRDRVLPRTHGPRDPVSLPRSPNPEPLGDTDEHPRGLNQTESRMLRNGHVRFGGRAGETHQPQS